MFIGKGVNESIVAEEAIKFKYKLALNYPIEKGLINNFDRY